MHSVVLLFLLLSSSAFAAEVKAEASALVVQFGAEPTQFDPLLLEDATALRLAVNVTATPYEFDGAGNIRKNLISQLSLSKDKKKYTLKFKKNLKWSDGVPFHSNQFVMAIQRMVKEPVKAALTGLFPEFDLSKTKALDALTAEVVLKNPDAQFENWLTLAPFAPIREDMLDAFSKRNPVVPSLAAYQVAEYKREDYILLKKNPEYVDRDSVSIEKVKILFLKDESSYYPLMKSGDLDLLVKVPTLQLDQIRKIAQITDVPAEAVIYLGLNTKKPPFNELKNRKAFLDAIYLKRGEIAKTLKTGDLGALTFLPSILIPAGVKSSASYEALKNKPEEKLEFNVQSDGGSKYETMLVYLQSRLKEEYRWKMKLDIMDWKAHYAKLKVDADEMFRFGWQNPVSDPSVMYQVLQSKSVNNFTGWSNAEYDQLVNELKQEKKIVKKAKLIEKIEGILVKEVPVVPVLHYVNRFANSKRVLGFRANSFGVILFRELRLAKN
jgi:oligopeptide transport system substrate-binding protein